MDPLSQFQVKPILGPLIVNGVDISFTNSSLFMTIALFCACAFLWLTVRNLSHRPSRIQVFAEMLYEMIGDMVTGSASPEAKKYTPFVFSVFLFVIFCNMIGMFPFSFTVTSHIIVTFALASFIFIAVTIIGFARHGLHYFSLFLPNGTPMVMAPLMILIEFVAYMVRPVSLSIRLAANMTAGHIVMKVIASFIVMLGSAGIALGALGVLPFSLLVLLTGFEIFVCILQAYVFAILSCVYLGDAIKLH